MLTLAQARPLCTVKELELVRASKPSEIGKLSASQLARSVAAARKLRDTLQTKALTQRRAKQAAQRSRQTESGARLARKSELFGEVMRRFEARLAKLDAASEGMVAAPKRWPRRARSATHRASRASARGALRDARLKPRKQASPAGAAVKSGATPKKPSRKKQPHRQATPQAAPPRPRAPRSSVSGAATAASPSRPRRGKKQLGGFRSPAIEAEREPRAAGADARSQVRIAALANQRRLEASEVRRIQGHSAAVNRRRQAKRDSR